MATGTALPAGNRLLDALGDDERARLQPLLVPIELDMKQVLSYPGSPLEAVYFPLNLVASLLNLVDGRDGEGVEVGTIGNEGLVGLPASWAAARANPRELVQVQVPGEALRMDAGAFTAQLAEGGAFLGLVQRHTGVFRSGDPAGGVQRAALDPGTLRPLAAFDPRPGGRGRVPADPGVPGPDARSAPPYRDHHGGDLVPGRVHLLPAGQAGGHRPRGPGRGVM